MIKSEEKYITIDNQQVFLKHLRQENFVNDPYTLVLLHDSLGCVTLWRDWPEMLAKSLGCNVLVYDRIGYGKSDKMKTTKRSKDYLKEEAYFLDKLLDQLQIDEVAVFGHSDGASISLLFAAFFPDKTLAVVSEAAHIFVESITLEGIKMADKAYRETNLKERLEKYHGDKVDDIMHAWVDNWLAEIYLDWNVEEDLENITAPLLFIQGSDDEYGTLLQVDKTLARVKGHKQKKVFLSTGHTPHKEKKEETLEVIVEFLNNYVKA
ncbi:alpha/beta fold hydrolase [Myroides injenensis]|uniref:alpha/beta fold hydrolase n=1 Tax=Myroides injenensis TaxID=1183151 RepID=UPI000287DCCE|nr:alpha/beta hydrolase [Myroides injenensis]